jgi:hypothetical protein
VPPQKPTFKSRITSCGTTSQTARSLIYRENLGISASRVLARVTDVMIFCSEISRTGANAVGKILLPEVYDSWTRPTCIRRRCHASDRLFTV